MKNHSMIKPDQRFLFIQEGGGKGSKTPLHVNVILLTFNPKNSVQKISEILDANANHLIYITNAHENFQISGPSNESSLFISCHGGLGSGSYMDYMRVTSAEWDITSAPKISKGKQVKIKIDNGELIDGMAAIISTMVEIAIPLEQGKEPFMVSNALGSFISKLQKQIFQKDIKGDGNVKNAATRL